MTEEDLNRIIRKHQTNSTIGIECPSSDQADIEADYLYPRLHRAFLGMDQMTPGRTATYSETATKLLHRAKFEIENGRKENAMHLITKVANSLLALNELELTIIQDAEGR